MISRPHYVIRFNDDIAAPDYALAALRDAVLKWERNGGPLVVVGADIIPCPWLDAPSAPIPPGTSDEGAAWAMEVR